MNRLVYVAGGSGFIGKHLCNKLIELGYEPCLITRTKQDLHKYILWNELEKLKDCHAIIGLQGQNIMDLSRRWNKQFEEDLYKSRINTTKKLVKAIQNIKTNIFISSSAIGIYEPDVSKTYDESYKSDVNYSSLSDFKGKEILFLAKMCHDWEDAAITNNNKNTTIIRTGIVLGPDGGVIKSMILPFKFGLGNKALGSGQQWFSWIHIDDWVGIVIKCIEDAKNSMSQQQEKPTIHESDQNNAGKHRIFNAVAPHACRNVEFHSAFAKALHRPLFLPAMPQTLLSLIMGPTRAQLLCLGQHVVPNATLNKLHYVYQFPDIKEACFDIVSKL